MKLVLKYIYWLILNSLINVETTLLISEVIHLAFEGKIAFFNSKLQKF